MTALHDSHAIPALDEFAHKALIPLDGPPRPMCGGTGRSVARSGDVTCPDCREQVDERTPGARAEAELHDSHAIGDDGPLPESVSTGVTFEEGSALAAILLPGLPFELLRAAVIEAFVHDAADTKSTKDAFKAAAARYAAAAGLEPDVTEQRIKRAVKRAKQSPIYAGDSHDVRIAEFWAQDPKPGEQFVRQSDGAVFTVKTTTPSRKGYRLYKGGEFWSARNATKRGSLHRIGGAA